MANPEHIEILKQGVEVWNRWREESPGVQPDLSQALLSETHLSGGNLSWTDLRDVDLSVANLKQANLSNTDFRRANLYEANLGKACLTKANLNWANLEGTFLFLANLRGADFSTANLSRAYLDEADVNDATMGYTTLGNIDLSAVKGLVDVKHQGRSYLDVHTLQNSKGKIPNIFLRGCGLSDVQIEMAKLHNPELTSEQITAITYKIHELLVDTAIHYHSCFISYSSKDEAFAQRLHADLQQKGVRCWFAPEDMKIGDKIRPTIDQSIRVHDKLLVILSENSMQSDWVEDEVEAAIEEERKRKETVLFPIQLDDAVMDTDQAWAAKLRRTRHIGDFSRWKDHDAYQQAFESLLRDLKADV